LRRACILKHYQRRGEPALIVVMHNCLSGRWRAAH